MNEKQTVEPARIRPTKKQKELLTFIENFIAEHGYSPSYREIMAGLNYTSVATVALHVNSLIKRGHLIKRDHSARSIEVVGNPDPSAVVSTFVNPGEEKWLVDKINYFFEQAEGQSVPEQSQYDQLFVLIGALKALGLDSAATNFAPRLAKLRGRLPKAK